jgi:hypothetical protein
MDATAEQRVISKFLCGEGTDPVEIHSRLLHAVQEDGDTFSSIDE